MKTVTMLRPPHMDANAPSPTGSHDPRLLLLDARDHVFCVTRALASGTVLTIEQEPVTLTRDFAHGDKVARGPIAAGTPVLKYGQPIGTATQDIARGEWGHLHNLKSNHLPTYLHGTQDQFFGEDRDWQPGEEQP
jgi:hypothetical protein